MIITLGRQKVFANIQLVHTRLAAIKLAIL